MTDHRRRASPTSNLSAAQRTAVIEAMSALDEPDYMGELQRENNASEAEVTGWQAAKAIDGRNFATFQQYQAAPAGRRVELLRQTEGVIRPVLNPQEFDIQRHLVDAMTQLSQQEKPSAQTCELVRNDPELRRALQGVEVQAGQATLPQTCDLPPLAPRGVGPHQRS